MDNLVTAELFTGNIEQGEIIIIEDGLPIEEELHIERKYKDILITNCILATLCLVYIALILYWIFPII